MITTVLFLFLGFVSFVFFPILNSLLDTLNRRPNYYLVIFKSSELCWALKLWSKNQRCVYSWPRSYHYYHYYNFFLFWTPHDSLRVANTLRNLWEWVKIVQILETVFNALSGLGYHWWLIRQQCRVHVFRLWNPKVLVQISIGKIKFTTRLPGLSLVTGQKNISSKPFFLRSWRLVEFCVRSDRGIVISPKKITKKMSEICALSEIDQLQSFKWLWNREFFFLPTDKNCAELYKCGQTISGVYTIDPDSSGAFDVYCDQTTAGGGWTVIQKRVNGIVDFNRTWKDFKKGFGDFLVRGFWLGLDKIQRLTQNKTENKLRVDLGVNASKTVHAEYKWFGIESEKVHYKLRIGHFSRKLFYSSLSHDHCHRWSLLSSPLHMVNLTALYFHVSISKDCMPWKYRCYPYIFILLCISHSWVQP